MQEIAILEVLRRHIYLILGVCIVSMLSAYSVSFVPAVMPEKYDATAIVLVRPQEPVKIQGSDTGKEFLDFPVSQMAAVETASKTYIEIIRSPALIGDVVRQLDLDKTTPQQEETSNTLWTQLGAGLTALYDDIQEYANDMVSIVLYGRLVKTDPYASAVKRVTKGLALKSYEDTYVFEIKYSDKDPSTAAAVANTTARLFIEFMKKMRSGEATYLGDQLGTQLEQSRQRLMSARQELENYKVSHKVFLYQQEYVAKLKVISDLQVEIARLDESLAASPGTLAAISIEAKRARLLTILGQLRQELAVMPDVERGLKLREADVDVAHSAYEAVGRDLKEAEIKGSDKVAEARLVSPAGVPTLPSHPRRAMIALVALLSGLMVGVTLAFFLEYVNRQIRGIRDVEDFVGLKVLATIPPAAKSRSWNWLASEPTS